MQFLVNSLDEFVVKKLKVKFFIEIFYRFCSLKTPLTIRFLAIHFIWFFGLFFRMVRPLGNRFLVFTR